MRPILVLAVISLASAEIYKETQSVKVGKRIYKCAINIQYTIIPPKCGSSTAKCKPKPRKPVKFAVEIDGADLSFFVTKNKVSKCMVVPINQCADKSCGDVCATSQGILQVMRYCQPDGSCEINSTPKCPDTHNLCAGKSCGDVCATSQGMLQVMRYCQPDGSCQTNSSPKCPEPNAGCIYDNRNYALGQKINIVEKCSTLICNLGKLGPQWDIQVLGHSCCQHNGRLLEEGDQVMIYNGQNATCCEGQMVVPINGPGTSIGITNIEFSENGQIYTQVNTYNSSNGLLTLVIPPHKDYSKSTFILDPEMKQEILSSNGTCLLSGLSRSIDVYKMAEEIQENKTAQKYDEDYKIKIRKSILRQKDRQYLNLESRNLCKNQVVRKTIDKGLSKEEFEGLLKRDEKGESSVVVISNPVGDEEKCWIEDACTNPGPNACGYGFPNPAGGGFTAHQLSATVICVQCCLERGPGHGCCKEKYSEYCRCADIKNKIDLMDCILGNETHYRNYEDLSGKLVPQYMSFNAFNPEGNARALKFHVPSHDNYEDFTTIMHAAQNGYWHYHNLKNNMLMKIRDTCHILDLPSDVFPMDLAVNLLEQGLEYIKTEDQTIQNSFLRNIGFVDYNTLHPDIQKLCRGLKVVKSERIFLDIPIKQQFQLNITSNHLSAPVTSCCSLETATTYDTGCIKWPNPAGGPDIAVHEIVSAGVSLTCCLDMTVNNPGCNPTFPDCCGCHCTCSEITSKHHFSECLGRPQIPLRKRMTQPDTLTDMERHNLLSALDSMKADTSNHGFSHVSSYHGRPLGLCGVFFCCIHGGTPSFLAWHRLYMVNYDTGLRRYKHAARLPYWDWTTPMSALPDLVVNPTINDPIIPASIPNPFYHTSRSVSPLLLGGGSLPGGQSLLGAVMSALDPGNNLAQFINDLNFVHGWIHVWIGGSMGTVAWAATDPIFYLHHNMIDLIWAVFQYLKPLEIPTPGQQSIQLNPFYNTAHNPNRITLANTNIGKTLDYQTNLCYTYDLDIGNNNIVFGGMTLSQISDALLLMRKEDLYFAGFFFRNYNTSVIIKFNICYKKNMKESCYSGGEIPIFGGSNQIPYINDVVTKIDVTKLINRHGLSIKDFINSVRFEVEEIVSTKGEQLSKDMVFQPVNIYRPKNYENDRIGIYFGKRWITPPQITIIYGTYVFLLPLDRNGSKIYMAKNKEAFEKCDTHQATLLSTFGFATAIELGFNYFFDAEQRCQPNSKIKIFAYSSRSVES